MKSPLINQPTAAPTRKLTASLIGMVCGAVAFSAASQFWPWLAEIQIEGVGDLSLVAQLISGAVFGWFTRDRA